MDDITYEGGSSYVEARNHAGRCIGEIIVNECDCRISGIQVDRDYQGQNVGSQLLLRGCQLLQKKGCSKAHVYPRDMQPFYCGSRKSDVREFYRKNGFNTTWRDRLTKGVWSKSLKE